jgi:hypothetical protein
MGDTTVIGLAEAAHMLKIPYQDCHRLVLTGRLRGEKRNGRWQVVVRDIERVATELHQIAFEGVDPKAV